MTRKRDAKRTFGESSNSFMSLEELSAMGYGDLGGLSTGQFMNASPISIFKITPDALQPRRAIPLNVRHLWDGNPQNLPELFELWVQLIQDERAMLGVMESFRLESFFERGGQEAEPEHAFGHVRSASVTEDALFKIVELAVSIWHQGLTNPITIAQKEGDSYSIETGERRWLAFHLLNALGIVSAVDGRDRFEQIPARTVEQVNVWRQAAENGARDNLNAIGRARQLALLLMDTLTAEGAIFTPASDFTHEQDYYAQVADGNDYRIPRGQSDLFLVAMGLKNPRQLRDYRALLRIPRTLWEFADDHNLTEGEMRKANYASPTEYDYLQVSAPIEIATPSTPPVKAPEEMPRSVPIPESPLKLGRIVVYGSPQYFTETQRIFKHVGFGDRSFNQLARQRIQEMRGLLDEIEARLDELE
ncbi:MAG: ParB N-terminal domain-containing protein [Phototrophicaceae bacterium]